MQEVGKTKTQNTWRLSGNSGRKEENVLFNDTLNTFYLRLYVYGYMASDIW